MIRDPRAAHSGELAQSDSALGIWSWEMETEPGDGDGVTAERSPGVRQMIMMAMLKLSPGDAEEAGGRSRRPEQRELPFETL